MPDNKKILYVINGEHYSGAERVQDLLGIYLPYYGYDVTFVTLLNGRFKEVVKDRNYKVLHIPMKNKFDLSPASGLADLVKKESFSLIHGWTVRSSLVGRIAAKRAKVPFLSYIQSPVLEESTERLKNTLNYWLEKIGALMTTHYVCASQHLQNGLISAGIPQSKTSVAHNGIPVMEQIPAKKNTPLDKENWRIGFVALSRPRKGLEILLEAAHILAGNKHKIKLIIVGPFETERYKETILHKIHRLCLEDIVEFTGFTNDVKGQMQNLDILALPSLFGEGVPLVALEAMALGLPVVSTQVCGLPELIPEDKYGLLCKPSDPTAFANALERLIENPRLINEIRMNAYKRQSEHFSARSMTGKVAAVYDSVLGNM